MVSISNISIDVSVLGINQVLFSQQSLPQSKTVNTANCCWLLLHLLVLVQKHFTAQHNIQDYISESQFAAVTAPDELHIKPLLHSPVFKCRGEIKLLQMPTMMHNKDNNALWFFFFFLISALAQLKPK